VNPESMVLLLAVRSQYVFPVAVFGLVGFRVAVVVSLVEQSLDEVGGDAGGCRDAEVDE
jgi:hypothetical protein